MEEMYQKYNPEYLAATNKPMEVAVSQQEGKQLVTAANDLNQISQ